MEDQFYTVDGVEDFSANLSCGAMDAFKYLVSCKTEKVNPEDAELLTPDLLEAYKGLKENCEEFIRVFDYYSTKL